ncbi:hypothetical protein IKE96_00755 [bacterium]|nr:hypothetical protein [bacterium]
MIKVIYGSDSKLLELELQKELKINNFGPYKVIKDLENFDDLYLATNQINLFLESKTFVFYNNTIFQNIENFLLFEKYLLELINNQEINLLIIYNNKLSLAKKIQEFINKIQVTHVQDLTNEVKADFIMNFLTKNNCVINQDNLDLISNKLPNDAMIIENELSKIIYLNSIDSIVINNLITNYNKANIFSLLKSLVNDNLNQTISDYNKIIAEGEDVFFVFQILSFQAMQLFFLKKLKQINASFAEISSSLKISYYSYKELETLEKMINFNKLTLLLDNLYFFDLKLKNNLYDKNSVFKIFLLKLFKLGF